MSQPHKMLWWGGGGREEAGLNAAGNLVRRSLWFEIYRSADESLARPGRKQATATEDFKFHKSYL